MKDKMIGLWIMVLSVLQLIVTISTLVYQYILMNYSLLSFSVIVDILSVIFVPAIFFFIGMYIRNKN